MTKRTITQEDRDMLDTIFHPETAGKFIEDLMAATNKAVWSVDPTPQALRNVANVLLALGHSVALAADPDNTQGDLGSTLAKLGASNISWQDVTAKLEATGLITNNDAIFSFPGTHLPNSEEITTGL